MSQALRISKTLFIDRNYNEKDILIPIFLCNKRGDQNKDCMKR